LKYFLRRILWDWLRWLLRRLGLLPVFMLALPVSAAYTGRLYTVPGDDTWLTGTYARCSFTNNGTGFTAWQPLNFSSDGSTICGQVQQLRATAWSGQLGAGGNPAFMVLQVSNAVRGVVTSTFCSVTVGTYGDYLAVLPTGVPPVQNHRFADCYTNNTSTAQRWHAAVIQDGIPVNVGQDLNVPELLLPGQWWCFDVTTAQTNLDLRIWCEESSGDDTPLIQYPADVETTNSPATNTTGGGRLPLPSGTNAATANDIAALIQSGAEQNAEGRGPEGTNAKSWAGFQLTAEQESQYAANLGTLADIGTAAKPTGWAGLAGEQSAWRVQVLPAGFQGRAAGWTVNLWPADSLGVVWTFRGWVRTLLMLLLGVIIWRTANEDFREICRAINPQGVTIPNFQATVLGNGGNWLGVIAAIAKGVLVLLAVAGCFAAAAWVLEIATTAGVMGIATASNPPAWLTQAAWFVAEWVPVAFALQCVWLRVLLVAGAQVATMRTIKRQLLPS